MICFIFFGCAMGFFYIYSAIDEASNSGGSFDLFYLFFGLFFWAMSAYYYIYKKSFLKGSEEYLNDKNDGLYWIKTEIPFLKEFYKIEINTNNKTLTLESNGKNKVYHFSEITNFGFETHKITNGKGKEIADIRRTQYYIKTKDSQMPVWYFKFVVKGRVAEDLYIDRLTELYEKWHQIIVITLNHAVK